jgi:hypothetical protein
MSEQPLEESVEGIEANLGAVTYIMLARVYDLLILLCDAQGKGEDALRLMEMHKQGLLMCPIPSISTPELKEE